MRVSGPGFAADEVRFSIERQDGSGCAADATGTHALGVEAGEDGRVVVAWEGPDALGVYVTEPGARLPLGPGVVSDGATYWAVQTTGFPAGFAGPVVYGEVPAGAADVSEVNGAPVGGAVIAAGTCVVVQVQFADFSTSTLTRVWE